MEITCINCGQPCEVEDEPMPGQHLLCPFCDVKFSYTPQNTTSNNADGISNAVATQGGASSAKIKTSCPHCGAMYEIDAEFIGEAVKCGTCDRKFVVTETQTAETHGASSSGWAVEEEGESQLEGASDDTNEHNSDTVRKERPKSFSEKMKAAAISTKAKTILLGKSGWKGRVVIAAFAALFALCLFVPFISYRNDEANFEMGPRYLKGDGAPKDIVKAAVEASVKCFLDFVRRPNDRRWQALTKSLVSCPVDFQDAVKRYLASASKTVDDFMPEYTEEDFEKSVKYHYENNVRPGSIVDVDPRFASLKLQIEAAAVNSAIQSRKDSVEAARFRLKTEIEMSINNLIDIAEKYGIDPIKLEDALL